MQTDLNSDDVMLLDAFDEIFIWIGAGANKVEKDNAEKVAIVSSLHHGLYRNHLILVIAV